MCEFALLTIQKKIDKEKYPLYWNLYLAKKAGESYDRILQREGIDPAQFGKIRFVEDLRGIYVEHVSNIEAEASAQQLKREMEIASEWLMCFSFSEMNVIGLDMGVFEAGATVADALERLRWAEIADSNFDLFVKREALIRWLKINAKSDDRIYLCSDWIFYHPDGKYDYYFVQNYINERIVGLRETVQCNQWSKNPIVRPQQVQMTA
jgi:hypothetical protein